MNYIRWFREIRKVNIASVGGKGANLGEMAAAGFTIPLGFCLVADAYRLFIEESGLKERIAGILAAMDIGNPIDLTQKAADIRHLIERAHIPPAIAEGVRQAYRQLGEKSVAVRSSATAEDLPEASFAGQQETYLNVRGEELLLEHIQKCWASLWTDRAIAYRARQGFDHEKVYLAVVVQEMVASEKAGVLFTANPTSGDPQEIVIDASWGLGEAVVANKVTPDTYVVRKAFGTIVSRTIGSKEIRIDYAPQGGTQETEVTPKDRARACLDGEEIEQLVELGKKVEAHYGAPQDLEWAFAAGRLYLLQSRNITTPILAAPPVEWSRAMFIELFPEPLTPAFTSVIQNLLTGMLEYTFRALGFSPPQGKPAVGIFYSQVFFSRNYIEEALKGLTPPVGRRMAEQMLNPFGEHERTLRSERSLRYLGMLFRLLRFMTGLEKNLPRIIQKYREGLARYEKLSLKTASDQELAAVLDTVAYRLVPELLNTDFLMISMLGITYQALGRILQPYFEEETDEVVGRLISGVTGNKTMETNKRLWDLAVLARGSPPVREILVTKMPQEVISALEESEEGRVFLVALGKFLRDYGHREIRMDIIYPTWKEDPAPVFSFLRGYLKLAEPQDPYQQEKRLARQSQETARMIEERLSRDAKGRWLMHPLFRWLWKHCQYSTRERDTMHFQMTASFPILRSIFQELGGRWSQAGWIQKPDDIYYLHLEEIMETAARPRRMQETEASRRQEWELNRSRPWPIIIRGKREIYIEEEVPTGGILKGVGGSPGLVQGPVRIVLGPEDFPKLQSGDIMVAPLTTPVWTPLFSIAKGLVADVGGVLSHGAIVAREYGIPAVMGTQVATKTLKDGQVITVDGDRGLVLVDEG